MKRDKDKAATERALAALDEMAEEWAKMADLDEMAVSISLKQDRAARIVALAKQAFVEGAYKCYCDAKDGNIPWLKVIQ